MTRGLYVGSFDPLTNGHRWMIAQGARLFDELVVAVGTNPSKQSRFGVEQRIALIEQTCADIRGVRVVSFPHRFAVDYAREIGATHLLRGMRSARDLHDEMDMRHVNEDIARLRAGAGPAGAGPEAATTHEATACGPTAVFLMPPRALAEVSSSLVKGLVGFVGWEAVVQQYVPAPVFAALQASAAGELLRGAVGGEPADGRTQT